MSGSAPSGTGPEDVMRIEARGPIRIVTLNRPEALNAANDALHTRISEVWSELAEDEDAGAVVLTGAGRAFSGGGDLDLLDGMTEDPALREAVMTEAADLVRGMTSLAIPIVAAVNGPAVGLGCSLASMCDLVVMEEQAYFADPHVALGLVAADGGALTWPLLTSLMRAKEYILLGDRLPAEEAKAIGLVNRVVPKGESLATAIELAERLAALPPQSVRETKRLLNAGVARAVEGLLDDAVATETASFLEPAFQANLARMRKKAGK